MQARWNAGITTVLLPERNRRDLEDVTEEVRQKITIERVSEVDHLLAKALEPPRADT